MAFTPADLFVRNQIISKSDVIFYKVDDGIYEVRRDLTTRFAGRRFVNTQEVISELNEGSNVVILEKDQMGVERIKYYNF